MRFFYLPLVLSGLALSAAAQSTASYSVVAPPPASPTLLASAAEPIKTPAPTLGLLADRQPATSLLTPRRVSARKLDFSPSDKPSFIPVPVAFYQQETGFAVGAAILPVWRFGTDTTVRKSNARLLAWFSQKKQTTIQLTHTIFTPGEKFYFSGELSYYDLQFDYFGVGNNTRKSDKVQIQYPLFVFDEKALVRAAPNLFVGVRYRLTNLGDVKLQNSDRYNSTTNQPVVYNELANFRGLGEQRKGTISSGVGPSLLYDGRDNVLATYRGNFVDAHILFNGGALGSDYRFTRYQIDARHFNPLFGSNNTILALQFMGQYHSGDVPFRELGGMGGTLGGAIYNNAYLMRGIYEARFRDRQFTTVQAEIRQKLIWRFDIAAFIAAGQVGYDLNDYTFDGTKLAGGVGARFRFNRRDRLNIRLDYGVGSGGNSGIIFAVGEAF
ncbi:BamA/TamA family outer membrane protein [Hymenobacter defluvii]|uniref:BamA/TamA family outer membrane protein n=1 Tax=Hymenobacter defluvii TaxID=2054411 RepID=A0ABS3TCI3_9BACT|nr:BamA/TamA family outer membrane protein [Hymenobacter defluvii]MBO3271371.1 BamA/TamA family outer membrane protein [Hymenobacter defluvii]